VAFNLCTDNVSSCSVRVELESEAYREAGQRTRLVVVHQHRRAAQQLRLHEV
jgi:hypothetical protein